MLIDNFEHVIQAAPPAVRTAHGFSALESPGDQWLEGTKDGSLLGSRSPGHRLIVSSRPVARGAGDAGDGRLWIDVSREVEADFRL